jgi:penicillin G amidase
VAFEILPDAEMPHLINPATGWFVNANNDPAGTVRDNNPLNQLRPGGGLYYLNAGYDFGLRASRITELIEDKLRRRGTISLRDMKAIQADVVLPDAPYFVPYIKQALTRAGVSSDAQLAALGQQPAVQQAVARLAAWKFTTPTGIPQGYDAADASGRLGQPDAAEIAESVAATLYSVWRGQFIRNTIDATLDGVPLPAGVVLPKPGAQLALTAVKNLLERPQPGIGASGINFFNAPAASAEDRRDIVILKSLADSLTRLAGPDFAAAFGGSTKLEDYRWGKLHRIVFAHPLGGQFSVPPAFGLVQHPLGTALPGFPADGGFGAVDSSNHDLRAQGANGFMFNRGAVHRFVAEGSLWGVQAESIWPVGTSADPASRFYLGFLTRYLVNDTVPLLFGIGELLKATSSVVVFIPAK